MTDQADEIRQRLEARQQGVPFAPPQNSESPVSPKPFRPETQAALEKRRKLNAALAETAQAQPVVIVDIRMRFWSMAWFMVKWSFATIPALVIIFSIMWALFLLLDKFR